MKMVLLSTLILLLLNIAQAQYNFPTQPVAQGTLGDFWLVTYSIGNYSGCNWAPLPPNDNLAGGGDKGNQFNSSMKSYIQNKYPNTRLEYRDFRDNQVTPSSLSGGMSNVYDMVFFFGHGGYGSLAINCTLFRLVYAAWEGGQGDAPIWKDWTKWVVLNSCKGLYYNSWETVTGTHLGLYQRYPTYAKMFKGVHALIGYQSNGYNFTGACKSGRIFGWCPAGTFKSDQNKYDTFARNWIQDGRPLCEAWYQANNDMFVDDPRNGVRIKIIGVMGQILRNVNGQIILQPFFGHTERYNFVLNYPTPLGGYQTADTKKYWAPEEPGSSTVDWDYTFGVPTF